MTKIRAEVDGRDLRLRNHRLRQVYHRPVMEAFVVCAGSAQRYKDSRRISRRGGLCT
jgi:hypothetical protein